MRVLRSRWFVLFAASSMSLAMACGGDGVAGPKALESRLLAPCCYGGTLDVHESEVARELRIEIEGRMARGERAEDIQADFVTRYGEQVIAARSDAPFKVMNAVMLGAAVLAAAGIALVMRRWVRRARSAAAAARTLPAGAVVKADALDARLDAELADLE